MIEEDLGCRQARRCARSRRGRAAQSRGHQQGAGGLGPHHPRRLRPDRDHGADRQLARPERSSRARWAGRCPAIASLVLDADGMPTDEGEICLDLNAERPAGLMQGYCRRLEAQLRAPTTRSIAPATSRSLDDGRLFQLRRPRRRRLQVVGLPHQPVRAGKRAGRARGRGRGGDRALARRDQAQRPQGLASC